jgi:hypothetical protein
MAIGSIDGGVARGVKAAELDAITWLLLRVAYSDDDYFYVSTEVADGGATGG